MKYALPLIAIVAGCSTAPVSNSNTASNAAAAPDTCGAAAYQYLIGQDAVNALVVPDPKRSYRTDEAVTQDYVAERVNIQLDETDTIIAVTCG